MNKEEFDKQVEKNKKIAIKIAKGFLVIFGLFVALVIYANLTKKPDDMATQKLEPTVTLVPIEKYNIEVESMIVKKIGTKYRYFFSIKNADTKDFKGNLIIKGNTDVGDLNLILGFYSDDPLKAGLSRSVYPSANVNADPSRMKTFIFSATLNNQEVAKGSGTITDKFEDLSKI